MSFKMMYGMAMNTSNYFWKIKLKQNSVTFGPHWNLWFMSFCDFYFSTWNLWLSITLLIFTLIKEWHISFCREKTKDSNGIKWIIMNTENKVQNDAALLLLNTEFFYLCRFCDLFLHLKFIIGHKLDIFP